MVIAPIINPPKTNTGGLLTANPQDFPQEISIVGVTDKIVAVKTSAPKKRNPYTSLLMIKCASSLIHP